MAGNENGCNPDYTSRECGERLYSHDQRQLLFFYFGEQILRQKKTQILCVLLNGVFRVSRGARRFATRTRSLGCSRSRCQPCTGREFPFYTLP